MKLYILRHGIAAELSARTFAKDSQRPLTPEGERKLEEIAKAMKALEPSFDLILSSPYLRARQTAEIVAEAFEARKQLELTDTLTPAHNPADLMEVLRKRRPVPKEVLLVGHEPFLSSLVSLLVSGEPGLQFTLKKGGLCKLSLDSLKPGCCASMEWLLTPKQMSLMA